MYGIIVLCKFPCRSVQIFKLLLPENDQNLRGL